MPKRGERVYLRKDGLWEARYIKEIDAFGKKKYGSVYARTCREAKEKRQEKEDHIRLFQKPIGSRNITVTQLAEEWLYLNQNRIKLFTYQRYEGFVKNHLSLLSKQPVLYLTSAAIHEFSMDRLRYGLQPQSVNSILVFIHSCLKHRYKQYHLPMPEILYLSAPGKEMRVLTCEEQKQLMAYLNDSMDVYKFGVVLTLYTGLRIGEICSLKWEDISKESIHIRRTVQRLRKSDGSGTELYVSTPKTNTSIRIIPIPSFLSEMIETYRNQAASEFVLGNETVPMTEPRVMQNHFKKYTDELNIKGATFHTLRHTFATRCVELGMDSKTLSELLGHSTVNITLQKYVHSSFDLKQRGMEMLKETL